MSTLTAQEVKKLLEREKRRSAGEEAASQTSPREYVSALLDRARRGSAPTPALRMPLAVSDHFGNAETGSRWQRIELAEGLELHVRADREAEHGRLAERIVSMAKAERKEKE